MSNILEQLMGGGQKRQEYDEFVARYEQGEPWEGIDDDEAVNRYEEVSGGLSDEDYELSAREAFERLSPDQRRELAQMLRQQGRQQNVDLGDYDGDDDGRFEDPREIARMTRHVRRQQPNGLAGLLGGRGGAGGGGGMGGLGAMLGNPVAKAALAGVAAMAAKRFR